MMTEMNEIHEMLKREVSKKYALLGDPLRNEVLFPFLKRFDEEDRAGCSTLGDLLDEHGWDTELLIEYSYRPGMMLPPTAETELQNEIHDKTEDFVEELLKKVKPEIVGEARDWFIGDVRDTFSEILYDLVPDILEKCRTLPLSGLLVDMADREAAAGLKR